MLLVACSPLSSPDATLDVRLEANRQQLAPSDTVALRVIAHNPSSTAVELFSSGCGHSLAAEVADHSGQVVAQSWGLPSICPVFDDNVLAAGETDTVVWRWALPSTPGTYTAFGGISRGTSLDRRGRPVVLRVE
jgi:hypothetical protein